MKVNQRLLIADDHELFCAGVFVALQAHPQFEIVATITRGNEVLPAVEEWNPDIVLLDINMPGLNGLEAAKQLRHRHPQVKIVFITMYSPADIGFSPTSSIADAYVLKESGSAVLLTALHEVVAGRIYLDPAISISNHHGKDDFANKSKLSSREKEILRLLVEGHSNKEIAEKLFLSELTIKTHRKNIMGKMGAHNLAELLRKTN